MITKEILQADPVLQTLSEDQISAILTLNTNDISAEIGKKTGEIYRELDKTIEEKTGIKRNGAEKSYLYLGRAIDEFKKNQPSVESLEAEIAKLKTAKADLESQIASGANADVKKQLDGVKAELENTKRQYVELQAAMTTKDAEHQAEILGVRVESELLGATKAFEFKKEIPVSVVNILVKQAIEKVKGLHPEFSDDGQGGKRLIFRGEDGATLNNPNNKLNPFTASELLAKELTDILQPARRQEGTGTTGPQAGNQGKTLDVSGARTRIEANEILTKQLLAQGLVMGSEAFDTAMSQAWKENKVSELPER